MLETELLSGISANLFHEKVAEVTAKYGPPQQQRRMGIIISSYSTQIDTRIKITNGQLHFVQKLGDGLKKIMSRQEIDLAMKMSADDLLKLVRIMQNFGSSIPGFVSLLQQYDNLLFDLGDSELKMYHQFGNNHFYGFELELKDESQDIYAKLAELGLQDDGVDRDEAYWHEYDRLYNLDCLKLDDADLLKLINQYLK